MSLTDDDLRHIYNRALAATDKPYPEAYLEGLRALVAAGWDEGHTHCFHVEDPKNGGNPYRG